MTLDGPLDAANVAIQMGIDRGLFHELGLYVTSATDDLGLTQQPQVALAKSNGAPVVAIGSLIS